MTLDPGNGTRRETIRSWSYYSHITHIKIFEDKSQTVLRSCSISSQSIQPKALEMEQDEKQFNNNHAAHIHAELKQPHHGYI